MPPDSTLHNTVRRICAARGIQPATHLDDTPIDRAAFRRDQVATAIHNRWGGRYDNAQPNPQTQTWITRHLTDPTRHATLLLNGATGAGKTHQAVAVLRTLTTTQPTLTWAATTHPDLGDQLRPRPDDSHTSALDRYLDAGLLLLDDLGAGMSTPWTTDCIQRLTDHRWTRSLATIYTTNLPPDALRAAVGDRVFSRLGDATHINLAGGDRRWQR